MRRPLPSLFLLLALGLVALQPVPARAGMLGDARVAFDADSTVTVNGRSYTGQVFHTPGRQRHEQQIQGMREVFILDAGAARGALVLPALKTYVDFPFPAMLADLSDPDLLKSPAGRETINGMHTTKYRVAHTAQDGNRATGFVWVTADGVLMKLDIRIARAGSDRVTTIGLELSNLRQEPQDPVLFEVPQGLVKLPADALAPLLGGKPG
jgi:hypothetical protein